jgi:hypothetical protein
MIVNRLNYKIKSDYGDLHKKNACRKKWSLIPIQLNVKR